VTIEALIFDFDGLILDTETADYQSWSEVYSAHGSTLRTEMWLDAIGTDGSPFDPYAQLESQIGRRIDRDAIRTRRTARVWELLENVEVLPGVAEFIESAQARGMRLGVASSSPREWVVGHLSRLGMENEFGAIVCGDEVENTKPDPEVYLRALSALGTPAEAAIAIEDSPPGISAAKSAGLYCISVPNPLTRQLTLDEADLVLMSLAEITLDYVIDRARERSGGSDP